MKDLVEATRFIYLIISKGQSPILKVFAYEGRNLQFSELTACREVQTKLVSIAVSIFVFWLWPTVNCLHFNLEVISQSTALGEGELLILR